MSRTTIEPASPAPTTSTRVGSSCAIRRRNEKSRLWKRTAPNAMNANVGPKTATDRGTTRISFLVISTRVTTTASAVTPASTTRRASWTLAYRHICP